MQNQLCELNTLQFTSFIEKYRGQCSIKAHLISSCKIGEFKVGPESQGDFEKQLNLRLWMKRLIANSMVGHSFELDAADKDF